MLKPLLTNPEEAVDPFDDCLRATPVVVVAAMEFLFKGVEGFSETNPVVPKSPILDFRIGFPYPLKDPTISDGLGRFIFRRELGL